MIAITWQYYEKTSEKADRQDHNPCKEKEIRMFHPKPRKREGRVERYQEKYVVKHYGFLILVFRCVLGAFARNILD